MPRSIAGKVLHDQWKAVVGWTFLAGLLAAFYLSLYPSIGAVEEMRNLLESMPPALRAMFAAEGVDISTPAGYLNVELFTFLLPLFVFAVTVSAGGTATAAEEEHGTLELLLANPVHRWRIVIEKFVAMTIVTAVLVAGIWLALAFAAAAAGIGLSLDRVAAALASAALLGVAIGTLAMAVGALTGSRIVSVGVALAVAIGGFFVNALGPLVEILRDWRWVSLHYHYIGYDPLANGLDVSHAAVLVAMSVVLLMITIIAFERRDLRS